MAPRSRAVWVLIISGALGFGIGMVVFPEWQVAVETAQVVAGIVQYPAQTPFYVYHTKLWTILHQICALFLLAGVSEITVSLLVSGMLGMVSFQALSMSAYALSRDPFLAVGAPFIILVSRAADFGVAYPVYLMGSVHTYGIVGLSTIVLAVALLAAGCYRLGGFLAGVAPAVHPSLGLWLGVILAIVFIWDFKKLREELRPALPAFLAGGAVTALSLIVHLTLTSGAPAIDAAVAERYLSTFVRYWDTHRTPVGLDNPGVRLNLGALAMALTWLYVFPRDLPRPSLFLLRVAAVAAVLSVILVFVTWVPPERIPTSLLILMPGRLLNLDVLLSTALLLGLVGAYRERLWSHALLLILILGLTLGNRSMLWGLLEMRGVQAGESPIRPLSILAITSVCLVAGAAASRWKAAAPSGLTSTLLRLEHAGVVVFAALLMSVLSGPGPLFLRDRTNDVFLGDVSKGSGILATGGDLYLIQLRTRRPVLVDGGALDGLPYSLEAAPQMERILRDVYDLEFFNPPGGGSHSGTIPSDANKAVWERYSREKWRDIGRTYQVTQVLTPWDWILNLPVAAGNRRFLLYEIPR